MSERRSKLIKTAEKTDEEIGELYEYYTVELRQIIFGSLAPYSIVMELLIQPPAASNYYINLELHKGTVMRTISEVLNKQVSSRLPLMDHFYTQHLTMDCMVYLTHTQNELLKKILNYAQ